ncbi:MhpC Predicted hydrolases or acyltransferases (alpha/beta hydrolase superfamily) [Sphingomonadaceae bacterium]|nr:alpha/beta hydrolase [uncultured Sphingorhabdus sp.]
MPFAADTGIWFETYGSGPAVFVGLPLMASHSAIFGAAAKPMLDAWLDALTPHCTVLLADYPGIGKSKDQDPLTMTATRVCNDLLNVATAAGIERFGWIGYSWSGAVGLQLATCSDRVAALAIGGWPPLGAPYANILAASQAKIGDVPDYAMIMLRSADQYQQWSAFYESVLDWPEAEAVAALSCPRMLFFGSDGDLVEAGFPVPIATACRTRRATLEHQGWQVNEIPGYGHDVIGQSALVLPKLTAFVETNLDLW